MAEAVDRDYAQVVKRLVLSSLLVLSSSLIALTASVSARVAAPAWGKIGGIGVGMLQDAVVEQHGLGERDSCTGEGCADVRYYGRVQVSFEHSRVVSVDCTAPGSLAGRGCPAGFALPDGLALGTPVPYRKHWRGYVRYTPQEPQYDFFYWKKSVRVGGRAIGVYLIIEKGKVIGITEAAAKSPPCGKCVG